MKEVYSVLVLMHPCNPKGCFEVLYSYNGKHYSSVDGNSPNYFKEHGLTMSCRFEVTPMQFYHIMAKSIASKLCTLDLHLRYKDKKHITEMLHKLSKRCVNAQCKYSEDLDIPEIVSTMANSKLRNPAL